MNFGIPAFQDASGKRTCPFASACAKYCYAQKGAYVWSNVAPAYRYRYEMTKRPEFAEMINDELKKKRVEMLRIHDSGDYYSPSYIAKWMEVIKENKDILFYSYTKSIPLFMDKIEDASLPINFGLVLSEGGTHDHLIDTDFHRHARIFANYEEMEEQGYVNAMEDDTIAILSNTNKIGLVSH